MVVGAGAVGGAIGGLLAEAGVPVVLVARGEHGAAIRRDGLTLRMPERSVVVAPPCVARVSEVAWRPGDLALVTTKLYDAAAAMDALLAAAGPELPVVMGVNGIAGERWAEERFSRVISMLVWLPATHLVPGEVRVHSGRARGVLDSGATSERATAQCSAWCERLSATGFDALPRPDIVRWKRAKLIANLGGTAQALVHDDWAAVVKAVRREGDAVLTAAGVDRVSERELTARVADVESRSVGGIAREGGSTWQSRARGRPLETPWLEGEVARIAERAGLDAPICRRLTEAAERGATVSARAMLGPD